MGTCCRAWVRAVGHGYLLGTCCRGWVRAVGPGYVLYCVLQGSRKVTLIVAAL